VLGALPAAAMLVWGRRAAVLSVGDVGLNWHRAASSTAVGLLVGFALAVPSVLLLYAPPLVGRPVACAPLNSLTPESLM
jgi:hypothetical protein